MDSPLQLVVNQDQAHAGRPYATLFGSFQLCAAGGDPVTISNSRARAILALLCTNGDHPLEREHLSDLLWQGRFRAHARASLRQCLFELGKLLEPLGQDILIVTRNTVSLNRAAIRTDLDELEQALRSGPHSAALRLLNGIESALLLERMEFGEAFASLLARRRQDIDARLRAAVERAVAQLAASGETEAGARLRAAWQRRDPGFGSPPAPDPHAPAAIRIAVLPFRALGLEEGRDYFSEGIAEELITTLGRVPQLQVAGRTSSFHFGGSDHELTEIAAALRVTHLVEGSVQCAGENVRIHVHLIEGNSGFEVWAQRYDGTLDAIFSLQETVAQAVSAAIGEALGIAVQRPTVPGGTASKEAYDLYLQGRALCARRFGDGVLQSAVNLFERALAIDPDYADCWVALAEAHQLISVYTQCLDRNGEAAIMADCARKAIELAPNLGYAHSLLGIYELTRFNFVGALDHAFRGYEREPGNPAVAMRLGCFLLFIGRAKDAAPYVKEAVDRDPVDGRNYAVLWGVHYCMGNLEEARAAAQRMVDLGMMSISLAVTLATMGDREQAQEVYMQGQQVLDGMILPPVGIGVQTPEAMRAYWAMAAKGICTGREEDRQAYWQVLEMLYAVLHDKSDPAISGPAMFTGHADLAYRTIGQNITPANLMALVMLWTRFEPICQIWQHPQFLSFARRIGMADAWDKYGWPDLLPRPDEGSGAN